MGGGAQSSRDRSYTVACLTLLVIYVCTPEGTSMTGTIENPILNSPYEQPDRYYEIGPQGPTGEIKDGRRPSESFIPIAITKKGKPQFQQGAFDFDATGERREKNTLINEIRRDVAKWRRGGDYAGVTPITRKLLQHWADSKRENRVIFAQREAAETAIFLTEVAGRTHSYTDWRKRLEPQNGAHNDGLPRAALKMATGSGKAVVMAMLIAWQTLNHRVRAHLGGCVGCWCSRSRPTCDSSAARSNAPSWVTLRFRLCLSPSTSAS